MCRGRDGQEVVSVGGRIERNRSVITGGAGVKNH